MAIHAVVRRVDLAADEPFPERRFARIEDRVIWLEPGEHIRIFLEAVGELVEPELFEDAGVSHVRLCLEFLGRLIVRLFLPMHSDLRFANLGLLRPLDRLRHLILPPSRHLPLFLQGLPGMSCVRGEEDKRMPRRWTAVKAALANCPASVPSAVAKRVRRLTPL